MHMEKTTVSRNGVYWYNGGMEQLKLPKRLLAAAAFVREGVGVADVGTDHGKLAAYLIASGRSPRVVATDISEASLKKAAALFARLGIEDRASAVLADGLAGVAPALVDDVVVAGLGAETIFNIIGAAPWLHDAEKRLVLVPSARHDALRRGLYSGGFVIEAEQAVVEGGHAYVVMAVRGGGISKHVSAAFSATGRIAERPNCGDNAAYLERVLQRTRQKLAGIEQSAKADERAAAEAEEIIRYIERIKGAGK